MLPDRVTAALRTAARPVCAYVYDTATLRATAAAVRAALPPSATLLYAVKANGHCAVVRTLAAATDGLEVASGGELALAVAAGARRIAFGGPAKTPAELSGAVAAGATVNVESVLELRRLVRAAAGRPVRVALRVNRAGAAPSGSHHMTGTATPFGLDEADLGAAVAVARAAAGVDLVGFHLHAVSNSLDPAGYAAFVHAAVAWSVSAAAAHGVDLREVNVGGGFGIDYVGGGSFDVAGLGALPAQPPLVFELGRYLAADAGWYAAEVLDLKRTHGRWFAVLRGGTHHFRLPAAWGYSHPFEVLPLPWAEPLPDRPSVRGVEVDAVGELCTPRDVLTRGQPVGELRVGDVLVFPRTGAYGWDISHHDFLRHPPPEVLIL
ncbi:MAG: type III PLP-dependent enzyme [Actinobacteria bacterium]|nr:MAG: type III PLP-dependent enzyme [Actinomycetota bacterium]